MALDLSWQQHLYCPPPPAALIGSGRKGRRKGSKNRSFVQRIDERDEKNEIKRQNERQRVKNISYQYNRLRRALGDPHPEKKLRKQQVLDACINYIQHLQRILKTADGGGGSVCYSSDSESTSCANTSSEDVTSFSFPACFTTNGGKDIVQDSSPTTVAVDFKLQCNESFHTLTDTSCPSSPPSGAATATTDGVSMSLDPSATCISLSVPPLSTVGPGPHCSTPTQLYPPYYTSYHAATTTLFYTKSPDIDPTANGGTSVLQYQQHHATTPHVQAPNSHHHHHQPSLYYEWNIGGDVELFDDYNPTTFAAINPSPPKTVHQSAAASAVGYSSFPPPLHHMY